MSYTNRDGKRRVRLRLRSCDQRNEREMFKQSPDKVFYRTVMSPVKRSPTPPENCPLNLPSLTSATVMRRRCSSKRSSH